MDIRFVSVYYHYLKSLYIIFLEISCFYLSEKNNYALTLFDECKPNEYVLLEAKLALDYFPELRESMPIKSMKDGQSNSSTPEWEKWNLFEAQNIHGKLIFLSYFRIIKVFTNF